MTTTPKLWTPFSYVIKSDSGNESYGLNAPAISKLNVNKSEMSATGLLATTVRDRQGDILEVNGIDFSEHKKNPIVLLDHGVNEFNPFGHPLPIGQTEDKEGNYKVWVDGQDCYQTTYFSQSSQMAEQVFHLICEGILRGNSIQFKALEFAFLPIDRQKKLPAGKHIKKSLMLEATWCAIPMNQDAVMSCFYASKVNGAPLCKELKEMLKPYINTSKKSYGVPMQEDKSNQIEEREVKSMPSDSSEIPADKPNEEEVPLGKRILASMSADCKNMMECYGKMLGSCEHSKVVKLVGKHLEAMKDMCSKMDELHGEEYNESDKKDDADGDSEDSEMKSKNDFQDEPIENKSKSNADKPGDKINTPEDVNYNKALFCFQKAWNAYKAESERVQETSNVVAVLSSEELTDKEQEELATLKRAIQRRIELINKM